jgi:hypothetical protein
MEIFPETVQTILNKILLSLKTTYLSKAAQAVSSGQ